MGFSDPTSFVRSLPLAASKSKKESTGVYPAMLGKEIDGNEGKDMCDGTVDLDRKGLERVESDDEIFANGGMCVVRTKRRTRDYRGIYL